VISKSNIFRTIHQLKSKYNISTLCKIGKVSRSGYYKWLNSNIVNDKDLDLKYKILKIYNGLGLDVINDADEVFNFSYDGRYNLNGECLLFPSKDNRDWSTFRPFKDGDILTYTGNYTTTFIYRNKDNEPHLSTSFYVACNDAPSHNFLIYNKYTLIVLNENCDVRIATEEEKQKLFDAIKENGYKWNEENKTLEKLFEPKFKVGDIVQDKDNYKVRIFDVSIEDKCYEYESLAVNGIGGISFDRQDDWELVPNKFDITTLKPFESKVLVRYNKDNKWVWFVLFSYR
jgi:hypothetical protein